MKIKLGVFFGGKSVEHEIAVITANQAYSSIDKEKYEVIPVYISKQGLMYTGENLFDDVKNTTHCSTGCGGCYEKVIAVISEALSAGKH